MSTTNCFKPTCTAPVAGCDHRSIQLTGAAFAIWFVFPFALGGPVAIVAVVLGLVMSVAILGLAARGFSVARTTQARLAAGWVVMLGAFSLFGSLVVASLVS